MKIILDNGVVIDGVGNIVETYVKDGSRLTFSVKTQINERSLFQDEDAFSTITIVRDGIEDTVLEGYGSPNITKSYEKDKDTWNISLVKQN